MIQEIPVLSDDRHSKNQARVVERRKQVELLMDLGDDRSCLIKAAVEDIGQMLDANSITHDALNLMPPEVRSHLGCREMNKCTFMAAAMESMIIVLAAMLQDDLKAHDHPGYPELDIFLERFQ